MKIETKQITVTPAMAKNWLSKFNNRNRNVRQSAVDNYATDMAAGKWHMTHQGIAFYADGVLADGQHRLLAVVKANVPVKFLVTNGLPQDSGAALDQHARRQLHDAMVIGGLAPWVNRNIVAIARFLMSDLGANTKPRSVSEVADYLNRHQVILQKVDRLVLAKKRHVTHSGVLACYVCALLAGEPDEKLKRFADIMFNGEASGPTENAPIKLRDYLMTTPTAWVGQSRVETCKRAMRTIKAFCHGQPLSKLVLPGEFMYPIPE
jgi:hypothetical protein